MQGDWEMGTPIENYREMVEQPWGKIFYDIIFRQLTFKNDRRLKILDFGAGFCITSRHYAKDHDVTAVEPNEEMYRLRFKSDDYTLITQGIDYVKTLEDNSYDVVLCHNVLEYADDKNEILTQLKRILKPDGILSIIKHNLYGRVFGSAVLTDNPKAALDLLDEKPEDSMFGNRSVYTNEFLLDFFGNEMTLAQLYGIRAFYGLSSNNEIKYSDEWYNSMLELEVKTGTLEEFKKVSFFNHLIFKKLNLQGEKNPAEQRAAEGLPKTIITVQHTQSVHHTNGHAGAWGDWDLTELGHKQAAEIGRYLKEEGCGNSYVMYASDLKRASQTAQEIANVLNLTPVYNKLIREVNAGAGNGKPWDWFNANKIPEPEKYDLDYKPFDDAESDRELWNRLYPFYREIVSSSHNKILIVSHGTALSFLQSMLMGQTLEDRSRSRFNGSSGSISRFEIDVNGKVTAKYINRSTR